MSDEQPIQDERTTPSGEVELDEAELDEVTGGYLTITMTNLQYGSPTTYSSKIEPVKRPPSKSSG